MIIPIFFHSKSETSKCPGCKKDENIKEICAHCGYEYKESEFSDFIPICIIVLGCFVFLWIGFTILDWLFGYPGNRSLLEVIVDQWRWILNKRLF
jgi:hypothetical protein